MKKLMIVMAMLVASVSQAEIKSPLYNCALTFDVSGGGAQVIVGNYKLKGSGLLTCVDIKGNKETLPLKVTMGAPIQASIGFGFARIVGMASGIGLSSSPTQLLGDYVVAGGQAALGVGAGAHVSLHAAKKALTLNADVQLVQGFGLNVGINTLRIEALN